MKRFAVMPFSIVLVIAAVAGQNALRAQGAVGSIRIFTEPSGARFFVDGQLYEQPAVFLWPAGSKHTVQFPFDPGPNGGQTTVQTSPSGDTVYSLTGWVDSTGTLIPKDSVQIVTADPTISSFKATLNVAYRVLVRFFNAGNPATTASQICGAPGNAPADQIRPGIVYVGGVCLTGDSAIFLPAGTVTLNAIPYPGFVFGGWSSNIGPTDAYLRSITVTTPITVNARFQVAKRVNFLTIPPLMQVLVDRATVPTPDAYPCPNSLTLPPVPYSSIPGLCFGSFDFASGSKHVIGAPSPQYDKFGVLWIFDSFTNGQGPDTIYTADSQVSSQAVVTAKFVPGARVSFLTNPTGLKVSVDGRDNWPGYNFAWAVGSKHQIAASDQTDSKGRRYTFQNWSNGGTPAQDIVISPDAATTGMRLIANYSVLSRIVLNTSPPGIALQVDGSECRTPCTVDRATGSQIAVSKPVTVSVSDSARLDFDSWSDGGAGDRTLSFGADFQTIVANYRVSYRLTAFTDPLNSVNFRFDPASPDMFYPSGAQVNVSADPKPGYKFRRWDGDLAGTFGSGTVDMSGARMVRALMDKIPFLAAAGVRNAAIGAPAGDAGDTPDAGVAPGSIISIFGSNLAPRFEIGPANPLSQTLAGVIVQVGDRLLPLLFVSQEQINAQVPSDLAEGDYTMKIQSEGQPEVTAAFTIARNAPGLFSQTADARRFSIASHEDGSPISPDSPVRKGELVTLFGTGFGPTTRKIVDGFLTPDAPAYPLIDSLEVTAGDSPLRPVWSGTAPGFIGLQVTRFRIPIDMATGSSVDLSVKINGKSSNTVTLPIQ